MLPKMYNSRMDVDPDYIPEFTDWYKRRHGPDVVSVGMYSAHGSRPSYHLVKHEYSLRHPEAWVA